MKKLFPILMLTALLIPTGAGAQAILDQRGDTVAVKTTDGSELLSISTEGDGSNISLSIGGFMINLKGNRTEEAGYAPASTKKYRRYFTVSTPQIGFIGLTSPDYSMYPEGTEKFLELRHGKSISFAFDVKFGFPLDHADKAYINFGLRPRWDNYTFDERITLVKRDGMVWPEPLGDMRRYKKSKLTTFTLDFPVIFDFYPGKHFSVSGGLYAGMTLGQFTKSKFRKDKDKGNFGVNFFNAGATIRVQYYCIGVFANYSFTPLFKSGAGPKTQPFTIGFVFW